MADKEVFSRTPFCSLGAKRSAAESLLRSLYYTEKALWKFSWFLRDFGYDAELLRHDEVDVRALMNFRLERFAQENRVHLRASQYNLQVKMIRGLARGHELKSDFRTRDGKPTT